jgi:hypothetical protein
METLGSLCDKLIVVKLKAYHTKAIDKERQEKLSSQERELRAEINGYINAAVSGEIPKELLTFESNKIHTGLLVTDIAVASIAGSIATLANINCDIWHLQERMYNFNKVPADKKDIVIRNISALNVQRGKCVDDINNQFKELIK